MIVGAATPVAAIAAPDSSLLRDIFIRIPSKQVPVIFARRFLGRLPGSAKGCQAAPG